MYLNGFSVRVAPSTKEDNGYVVMQHGRQYHLVLRNSHPERCAAKVEIDGKDVGTFRINGSSNITLERPAHDDGCFTFYKVGTREAAQAGLNESSTDLGLIRVTFTPEKHYVAPVRELKGPMYESEPSRWYGSGYTICDSHSTSYTAGGMSTSRGPAMAAIGDFTAGGTGLSGTSDQRFHTVPDLDYDYSRQTVIHIRLVADDDGPRPLTAYSTPVPPRVG
jgi:hypothetical protein